MFFHPRENHLLSRSSGDMQSQEDINRVCQPRKVTNVSNQVIRVTNVSKSVITVTPSMKFILSIAHEFREVLNSVDNRKRDKIFAANLNLEVLPKKAQSTKTPHHH